MRLIQYLGIGVTTLAGASIAYGAPGALQLDTSMLAPVEPQAIRITLGAAALDWRPRPAPGAMAAPSRLTVADPGLALTPVTPAHVVVAGTAGLGQALEPARLDDLRGGSETVSNEAALSGLVSGNSAAGVSTGTNIITGAAFSNASGIPVVIQNSGANVLIQNSTIVNLQLK